MISIGRKNIFYLSAVAGLIILVLMYSFLVRPLVVQAYEGSEPLWFRGVVEFLYPRFYIEKFRFSLEFFLEKSSQIVTRFSFLALLCILISWFYTRFESVIQTHLLKYKTSIRNVKTLIFLFYTILLIFSTELTFYLLSADHLKEFYKPILLFKILHLNWPAQWFIMLMGIIQVLTCVFSIIRSRYSFVSAILAAICFIYLQGLSYGFEKIDHGFATLTYASILMPFLLKDRIKAEKADNLSQDGFWLKVIMLSISAAYLLSGLEKLFISHLSWATANTFKAYLLLHNEPAGLALAEMDLLCHVLPVLALLFQLGFILTLFYSRIKWLILPAGIIFHVSTYFLFGAGAIFSPWWLMYIFFIPWDKLFFRKPAGVAS